MTRFRGFSLIEIVVSLFIFSVLLILFQSLLTGDANARATKDEGTALSAARSELEQLRTSGYDALPVAGPITNDLVTQELNGSMALAESDYNAKTKQVTVTVTWKEPERSTPSTVSLTTLITSTGGLP